MPSCWSCRGELSYRPFATVPRESECPGCGRDLHCCRNCRHYDPGVNNKCREPNAEWTPERERAAERAQAAALHEAKRLIRDVAGKLGLPQVVTPGAIDMVNFGPPATVPERFRDRRLYRHNPAVTLMRTSAEECAILGGRLAGKLNRAQGPLTVFIPLRGFSAIGVEGGVFHDPLADAALIGELKAGLDPALEVIEVDTHVNDPAFATAMAARLHEHHQAWARRRRPEQEESAPEPKEAVQQPVDASARP